MKSTKELSAIIRRAMRNKTIDEKGLANLLGISATMVEKLICGDVVPSRSLEKRMVGILGIDPKTARKVSAHRERASKTRMVEEEKRRRVA